MRHNFPFLALVGQDKMKTALILAVINPALGGVLIRGEKGTAKSTAVRAMAALLPGQKAVEGCPYGCDPESPEKWCSHCQELYGTGDSRTAPPLRSRVRPLVELPIGATEDRLLGSLNLEKAMTAGESVFEPGLLAQANRGILYVDEVNLLDDFLVDVLLDAAAMGRNFVEREGVSVTHPALFTLIGTMNPEEGELRPQLLDRFGLCVEVKGLSDPRLRAEVIKERLAYESDPEAFVRSFEDRERELGVQIEKASLRLSDVELTDDALKDAVDVALRLGVDGHRGDLTVVKTAMTLAAWEDRPLDREMVLTAAELALPHRMRRKPFQDVDFNVRMRLEEEGGDAVRTDAV
ncbi:MAG: ATP-binding protein [Deltaproteobacteria bacterium]|jgi:Mg-chelatase subunit ChlI|nr:ATP-binding protein [Deltaproteobacteria bacterium]